MTFRTLIRRSLRFYWRAHLGVLLGAAIGSAALTGALVVGDSVKESLRERALERLGSIDWALVARDRTVDMESFRFFSRYRATNIIGGRLSGVLELPATVSAPEHSAFARGVSVIGVSDDFTSVGGGSNLAKLGATELAINESLARHMRVGVGDELILRLGGSPSLSQEIAVSSRPSFQKVLRGRIKVIAKPDELGNYSVLGLGTTPPLNVFVALRTLQEASKLTNRLNHLLAESSPTRASVALPISNIRGHFLSVLGRLEGRTPRVDRFGGKFLEFTEWPVNNYLPRSYSLMWQLQDADLNLALNQSAGLLELRTPRVFLGDQVYRAVTNLTDWTTFNLITFVEYFRRHGVQPPTIQSVSVTSTTTQEKFDMEILTMSQPLLTYLVNLLRAGTNSTPYSMVTAAGPPWTPTDMRDEEIVVSQWLADDLRVKPGDEIALTYFDPESGARLIERTNTFRVRSVVPMEMPWADRTLMPDFPGIEKAESTRDWDAGFPLTYKIRDQDEDYWKQHRGTPKAFVTLAAGQKMWANRFGNLTAIRFPIPTNLAEEGRAGSPLPAVGTNAVDGAQGTARPTLTSEDYRAALEKKILATLKPEELGLRFEPVREQALKAAEESQDFGGLFLGFSFFLIAAALLLMAMLFQFGLEQRTAEVGTLLALGFTPKQVRRLLLGEGVALAFLGGVIGALGGIFYAKAMIHGLTTIWRDAVGASALNFHATTQTLIIGLFAGVVVSAVTIWLTLRKIVRRPARELLAGEAQSPKINAQGRGGLAGGVALAAAIGLAGWTLAKGDTANAGAFFGAGALVLVAGLSFVSGWLKRRTGFQPVSNSRPQLDGDGLEACPTLGSLAIRGCARRRARSLATVAMLACGSFLIVSIGVFRLDANRDATRRSSGTGGFALIGETTMPVVHDLNGQSGRNFFALNERDLAGVSFVPFRVHEGDEASCLNLNRAQKPRLLGVKPEMLERRFSLANGVGWTSLRSSRREEAHSNSEQESQSLLTSAATVENEIPAIGDANSIQWAMHKKVGDTIDYVDERGQPFKVRIVGAVANSILQGSLIIDEAEFVKRFPNESGYRTFLMDAPSNSVAQVSATLSRAMQDVGLELTPAAQRLAQFNAVQNTYLGTFQVLGGLGLLLGSAGLGIVVLRNVLERRGELAVLMAVGFHARVLQRLLLIEHGALLALGLVIGMGAAVVAVLPALLSPGAQLPHASLTLTLAAVLANGALWTWLATRFALRGNLLVALRNE